MARSGKPKIKIPIPDSVNIPEVLPVIPFSDEWFIIKFMEVWSVEHLEQAIRQDVDLWELVSGNPQGANHLVSIASNYDSSSVKLNHILMWFSIREEVRHLYPVLITPEGMRWLTKNMLKIKPKI